MRLIGIQGWIWDLGDLDLGSAIDILYPFSLDGDNGNSKERRKPSIGSQPTSCTEYITDSDVYVSTK